MPQTIRNKEQAITEAQRRWGIYASAWVLRGVRYVTHDRDAHKLGIGWNHFDGQGKTWDEAFADADKRLAEGAAA